MRTCYGARPSVASYPQLSHLYNSSFSFDANRLPRRRLGAWVHYRLGEMGGQHLARKPHPYFGFAPRLVPAPARLSDRRSPLEPVLVPDQQEGVLWDAVRVEGNRARHDDHDAALHVCAGD